MRTRQCHRTSSSRSANHIIYIHPLIVDVFKHVLRWSRACLHLGATLVTITIFTEASLQRLSLILLFGHQIQLCMDSVVPAANEHSQPLLPIMWLLGILLVLPCVVGIIFSSPFWWRPRREETVIMMTALFVLFLLEALLPIIIFVSSVMILMRHDDWLSGLSMVAIVLALLVFMTHFIRCVVYQTIGGH